MEADPREELAVLVQAARLHAQRQGWRGTRRVSAPDPERSRAPAFDAPPVATPVATPDTPTASTAPTARTAPTAPTPRTPARPTPSDSSSALPADLAPGAADLDGLASLVANCRACGLCETRKQTVFSDGSGRARVMFVGEAPGADEDASGVPFVGKAGGLLTDIITKGMKLRREDVYIANVLKCRPPGNRDPEPREKELCTPWLDRQIELINPEVIIPLGKHASQHMLGSQDSMGRMRGRVHRVRGRQIVPTYHPAFLLRSPHMKKECWADIQLAMGLLGLL